MHTFLILSFSPDGEFSPEIDRDRFAEYIISNLGSRKLNSLAKIDLTGETNFRSNEIPPGASYAYLHLLILIYKVNLIKIGDTIG